jgi:hypothetical protein
MNTEEVKSKRQRHQDRVTLDQECLDRVDGWIEQVTSVAKGVALSRKDVVNWIVKQHNEQLSGDELTELKARYFNEVRFLQQAIKTLQAAKRGGTPISLDEILANASHQTR